MRLLLTSIATGQLRKYVSAFSSYHFLADDDSSSWGGGKYITSLPAKKLEGLSPR